MNQQFERRVQKVENWSSLMLFGWLVGCIGKSKHVLFGATIFTLKWGPLSVLEVSLEPRIYPKTIV